MNDIKQYSATPHDVLIGELLDSCVPKTEREHAAAREIESLRAELAAAKHSAHIYSEEEGKLRAELAALQAQVSEAGTIAALGVVRTTENGVIQEVVVEGRGPLNYGDLLYARPVPTAVPDIRDMLQRWVEYGVLCRRRGNGVPQPLFDETCAMIAAAQESKP